MIPERIPALDAMRTAMALVVAVYHVAGRLGWTMQGADPLWQRGLAKAAVYSVEGFFILSGFAMFHAHARTRFDRSGLARFYLRRFLRLAPLFYAVLGLNLALGLPAASFATPRLVAESFALTFGFREPNGALVTGGWSVGVEVVFYAAFPALVILGRRGAGWIALAAAGLLAWSLQPTLVDVPVAPLGERFHAYVHVRNHAFLFLLGGLLAHARAHVRWRLSVASGAVIVAALVLCGVAWRPDFEHHLDMMSGWARYGFVALCWAMVAATSLVELGGWPGSRILRPIGNLSYGIYLLHPPVLEGVLALRPWLPGDAACLALTLAGTIVLAGLSWRFLEGPAQRLGRARLDQDASGLAQAPSTA